MALPASGPISISAINTEMGRASNAATNLNETAIRKLAGILSGVISLNSFYGKSRLQIRVETYAAVYNGSASGSGITVTTTFPMTRIVHSYVQIWGLAYGDGSVIRLYGSNDGGASWFEMGSHSTDRDYTMGVSYDTTVNALKATWNGGAYVNRAIQVWVSHRYVDITV